MKLTIHEVTDCDAYVGAFHVRYSKDDIDPVWTCVRDVDNCYHAVNRTLNRICEHFGMVRSDVTIVREEGYDRAFNLTQDAAMEELTATAQEVLDLIEETIAQQVAEAVQQTKDDIFNESAVYALRVSFADGGQSTGPRLYRNPLAALQEAQTLYLRGKRVLEGFGMQVLDVQVIDTRNGTWAALVDDVGILFGIVDEK